MARARKAPKRKRVVARAKPPLPVLVYVECDDDATPPKDPEARKLWEMKHHSRSAADSGTASYAERSQPSSELSTTTRDRLK